MLPVGLVSLALGLLAAYYATTVGTGAALFAVGFFVITGIALLARFRGHPALAY